MIQGGIFQSEHAESRRTRAFNGIRLQIRSFLLHLREECIDGVHIGFEGIPLKHKVSVR